MKCPSISCRLDLNHPPNAVGGIHLADGDGEGDGAGLANTIGVA